MRQLQQWRPPTQVGPRMEPLEIVDAEYRVVGESQTWAIWLMVIVFGALAVGLCVVGELELAAAVAVITVADLVLLWLAEVASDRRG